MNEEHPSKYKILIVEDDRNLGFMVSDYLESAHFTVELIDNGLTAERIIKKGNFDLALLDIMLPEIDGYTLAKEVKNYWPQKPIIFLTAKSMNEDRLAGLRLGVDDYITKPFQTEELKLRIEAVLRRTNPEKTSPHKQRTYVRIGKYRFYIEQSLLKFLDTEIELTTKESDLLELLFDNRNGLVTREMAFQRVWGIPDDSGNRNLDVYVGKLRKILGSDSKIHIRSIHGKGYKLEMGTK